MATALFNANSNYYIDVDAVVQSQNIAGNYSTIYWRVMVFHTGGTSYSSSAQAGNSGYADSNLAGDPDLWNGTNLSYNFINGQSTGSWIFAQGVFNVPHRSDGTAEYFVNGGLTLVNLGTAAIGTGVRSLPSLGRVPDAPTPIGLDNITQTSMRYRFSGNYDGGSPIREWQVGYGLDPNGSQFTVGSNGTTGIGGLAPGKTWYFWSRGRNDLGWGAWSARSSARTTAGARIKSNGVWKEAIPYVKVNGVWKITQPYVKKAGVWKQSI